ncbi:MAG TPA: galactose mutarotase [Candidatus Dorea intestinavium]|nr:galactose mutarotase [Candidatus Dorea intestinavium]
MMMKFGTTSLGEEATLYTLENQNKMVVTLSDFGATLVQVLVPDKEGKIRDVVLGYEDVTGYEKGEAFFGATVGRVANRIAKGEFKLNGVNYHLTTNDNGNNLHSGLNYYNKRMWQVLRKSKEEITFELISPSGDQGYPGEATIRVSYHLSEENELKITYQAKANEDTLFNMTNHSYFNLEGHQSSDTLSQEVWLNAQAFTPIDKALIPTGEISLVKGTPLDFTQAKEVGKEIDADFEQLKLAGGFDHNYVLEGRGFRKVASLYSKVTGIKMEVSTDLPGLQFYSGNFIEEEVGKDQVTYQKRQGLCFETQYFPNAVNEQSFNSPILLVGEEYQSTTSFSFQIV